MHEIPIDANQVKQGQTVTRVVTNELSRWRKRPKKVDQDVRRINGRWPTVIESDFRERGEGGEPTVYLTLSDAPGWTFCLAPDDQVTIQTEG